jgi:radical SAM superfamily enzyme YgiQ (UPF0313 family)
VRRRGGYPIVLTADRTLMADYPVLFDGMMGTIQTTSVPEPIMRRLVAPPLARKGVRARKAPLGVRRIEAALIRAGLDPGDLIVARPEDLGWVIGPETAVVAVSSSDPLGCGMSNTTMTDMAGGRLYTHTWYRRLVRSLDLLRAARKYRFRLVAGGAGAWQLEQRLQEARKLGIDCVVSGHAERLAPQLFRDLLEGGEVPAVVHADGVPEQEIPPIRGATSMGVVEVSRGCGKGCHFCTIARDRMIHLPVETIVKDVERNVEEGVTSICALSEDFFRYGCRGQDIRPAAVKNLATRLRQVRGLKLIQLDHCNVVSAALMTDQDLRELHDILVEGQRHRYLWVNLGVETASGELLDMNQKGGKIRPFRPEEWGTLCEETVRRLIRAGFFPMVSLILGLPGERPEHVEAAIAWVQRLSRERLVIFPIFYSPVVPGYGKAFTLRDMTPAHWRLFRLCYNLNFKWIPRMYWDNQTGAGVPLWRRLFIQVTGHLQILQWTANFVWQTGRLMP